MIEIISGFALIVIIFLALFWVRKTLFLLGFFFKLFLLFMLACIIGTGIFGYMVYNDVNDFKDNFMNTTSVFILKNEVNGSVSFVGGMVLNPSTRDVKPLNHTELVNAKKLYDLGDISDLSKQYYKVFVVDSKSFDQVKLYNISDQNIELTREEIKKIVTSNNSRDELAGIIAAKRGISKSEVLMQLMPSNEEVNGYILSYYLATVFDVSNMGQFISELKSGNIKVYDETALFKAVKLVPQVLIDKAISVAN